VRSARSRPCFRMVSSFRHGAPTHCPKPVEFQGQFQDGTDKWHTVWGCIDHAPDLSEWKRVNASVADISSAPKTPFRKGGPAVPLEPLGIRALG